ncbi:hypothetical protein EWM64_g9512, partial [Hericium alpestre]
MVGGPSNVIFYMPVFGNVNPSDVYPTPESLPSAAGYQNSSGTVHHYSRGPNDMPQLYIRVDRIDHVTGRVLSFDYVPWPTVSSHNVPSHNAPPPNALPPNALPSYAPPPNVAPPNAPPHNVPLPSPYELCDVPPVSRQDPANQDNAPLASLPYPIVPHDMAAAPSARDAPNTRPPRHPTCDPRACPIPSWDPMNGATPENPAQHDVRPSNSRRPHQDTPSAAAVLRPHRAAARDARGRPRHRVRIDDQERAANRAGQYRYQEVDRDAPDADIAESEHGSVRTSVLERSPNMSGVVDDEQQFDDFRLSGHEVPIYEDPTMQDSAPNDASALFPRQFGTSPMGYNPSVEAMYGGTLPPVENQRKGKGKMVDPGRRTETPQNRDPGYDPMHQVTRSEADAVLEHKSIPPETIVHDPCTASELQYGHKIEGSPAHASPQNGIMAPAEDESERYRALATSPLPEKAELGALSDLESEVARVPTAQLEEDSKHKKRIFDIKTKLAQCEVIIEHDVKKSLEQYDGVLLTLPSIIYAFKNLAVSLNNVSFNLRFIPNACPAHQQVPKFYWLQKQQTCLESVERNADKLLDFCNITMNAQTLRIGDMASIPDKIKAFDLKMRDIDHLILLAHHALCEIELRAELHTIRHNIRTRRHA